VYIKFFNSDHRRFF